LQILKPVASVFSLNSFVLMWQFIKTGFSDYFKHFGFLFIYYFVALTVYSVIVIKWCLKTKSYKKILVLYNWSINNWISKCFL